MKEKKKGRIIKLYKHVEGNFSECEHCGAIHKMESADRKEKPVSRTQKAVKEVKVDYPKLTFRLSVFGAIASLAFYVGVLRDLQHKQTPEKPIIEQVQQMNSTTTDYTDSLTIK